MFGSHGEAKANGWFSRRHETREANDDARERYQKKAKPRAKIARRAKRAERAAKQANS